MLNIERESTSAWGLQLHVPTGWDIKGDEWQYSFLWQPFRKTLLSSERQLYLRGVESIWHFPQTEYKLALDSIQQL